MDMDMYGSFLGALLYKFGFCNSVALLFIPSKGICNKLSWSAADGDTYFFKIYTQAMLSYHSTDFSAVQRYMGEIIPIPTVHPTYSFVYSNSFLSYLINSPWVPFVRAFFLSTK